MGNKTLITILLGSMLAWPGSTTAVFAQTCGFVGTCGDVDNSGSLSTTDALKVLRQAVGQDIGLICQCSEDAGTCEADLLEAEASLSKCTGDLDDCEADLGGCTSDLATCSGDLSSTNADLGSCNSDLTLCLKAPVCGDGTVGQGEDCDVENLNGKNCESLEFAGGTLTCATGCEFDTSGCFEERFEDTEKTILDHLTGLEWEKKDSADGLTDPGNPHDADNGYTWSTSGSAATGTAFTNFLSELNGDMAGAGYAGHRDWRFPTLEELESIAALSPNCSALPCVQSKLFLPTRSGGYYTNTTATTPDTTHVWNVNFASGTSATTLKTSGSFVRAVRTNAPPAS